MLVDQEPEHVADVSLSDKGYISYYGSVDYNSENEYFFPTRGARFSARFAYVTDNFVSLKGKSGLRDYSAMWRMSFPLSRHVSVQPMLYGRLLFGENVPMLLSNMMGGEWFDYYLEQQLPFAGVGNLQMAWDKMLAAQMQVQVNITKNNVVMARFAAGQDANALSELLEHRTMLGGQLSYYYNMILGPLGGSIGYSNLTKKLYFYINLGFVF
jgi:NTE family protein